MLAHTRNGQLIRHYRDDKGWVLFENGSRMSPPVLGTYGNDKIVPVVEETIDNSTQSQTVRTDTGWQVEEDRVYRLITINDISEANAWANLRSTRNDKLSASDWTQVADAPVDQAAWATYRQALRDLPANTADPFNPVWPVEPV